MQTHTRAAAALATGALLAAGLAGCGDDSSAGGGAGPVGSSPPLSSSGAPTAPTSTGGSGGSSGSGGATITQRPGTVTVPAYFIGDTPQGPRLYREFDRVQSDDRLLAAAKLLAGTPADPDYRTPFPRGGGFDAVRLSGGTIEVDLSDPSWLTRGPLTLAQAELAVQALVYTLQGAAGQRLPVTVRAPGDGSPATTLFGVRMGSGFTAAKPLSVLAFVSVTSPEQDSTVTGLLAASGVASSFEGSVPWAIHTGDATGRVVRRGTAQAAGYLDKLYPWSVRIDLSKLPAGAYTFVASTDDPSGGEGDGPTTDSKAFTLR